MAYSEGSKPAVREKGYQCRTSHKKYMNWVDKGFLQSQPINDVELYGQRRQGPKPS